MSDRTFERLDRIEAILEKQIADRAEYEVQAEKRQAEIDKRLDKVIRRLEHVENFTKNSAMILEDRFFRGLEDSMIIDGVQYDDIRKGVNGKNGRQEAEYDIVPYNSDCLFIIEVKHKPHVNNLPQLLKQKKSFSKIFEHYEGF